MGVLLSQLGRLEEAEAVFKQALYFDPNYAEAHRNLSRIKIFKSKDDHFFKMRELYLDQKTSKVQLCNINFGLAKACEDLGDFEQAFLPL